MRAEAAVSRRAGPLGDDVRRYAREYMARLRREARLKVIAMYGGRCTCCDESRMEFLTVDHINGDGAAHRKELGVNRDSNPHFILKLASLPKRDDLQLLCANCHMAKDLFGGCPHQAS